jgi:putative membrane protein
MMWGNGFGMGGGWLLGGLMMLLFWAAVIGLVVWAIWAFGRRQSGRVDYQSAPQAPQGDRALQIAKERYARGEISREQYDEIRQTLGA